MGSKSKHIEQELNMDVESAGEFSEKEVDNIIDTLASILIAHWHDKESEQEKNNVISEEMS
jgi:hypothetical protein